jgi:hypothetical protein
MATDNRPRPGDSDVVLIRKILSTLGGRTSPGDSAYIMLRKILSLLSVFTSPDDALHNFLEKLSEASHPCPECPECPPVLVSGPSLMSSTITGLAWSDFEVAFVITQRYNGSPSDPVGAVFVRVQLGHRATGGEITWITDVQATWDIVIGAAPATQNDSVVAILETDKMVMRFRFLDASLIPLSEWSVSDELSTT